MAHAFENICADGGAARVAGGGNLFGFLNIKYCVVELASGLDCVYQHINYGSIFWL